MTIPLGAVDLGTPDGLMIGTQKESAYAGSICAKPERLKRVMFVRLQQRNASGIASRSTVAADKSLLRVLTPDQEDYQLELLPDSIPTC
jgi:hypothetical protein